MSAVGGLSTPILRAPKSGVFCLSMKKLSLFIVGSIVFLIALFVLGARFSSPTDRATADGSDVTGLMESELEAPEKFFDFGTISMAAGSVSHTFLVRNSNSQDIELDKIYTSCMCTTASLVINSKRLGPFGMPGHGVAPTLKTIIPPGAEAAVEVTFDPATHGPAGIGFIEREVRLEEKGDGVTVFRFRAAVTP